MAFPSLESIRTGAVLTATYVAGTDIDISSGNQLMLFLVISRGTSDLGSVELKCEIVLPTLNDRHFQELTALASGGQVHLRPAEYTLDVTALPATSYLYLPIPVFGEKARISSKGTLVAGPNGFTGCSLAIQAAVGQV